MWVSGCTQYIDAVQCIGSVPDRRTDRRTDKSGLFLCIFLCILAELRILIDSWRTCLKETRIWYCFITDIARVFCENTLRTPRKSPEFLTGFCARNTMQILAGSCFWNRWRIRKGNGWQSWQDHCHSSGYDPGRFPSWILIGSVIILSEENPAQFQKNPGQDSDWL